MDLPNKYSNSTEEDNIDDPTERESPLFDQPLILEGARRADAEERRRPSMLMIQEGLTAELRNLQAYLVNAVKAAVFFVETWLR